MADIKIDLFGNDQKTFELVTQRPIEKVVQSVVPGLIILLFIIEFFQLPYRLPGRILSLFTTGNIARVLFVYLVAQHTIFKKRNFLLNTKRERLWLGLFLVGFFLSMSLGLLEYGLAKIDLANQVLGNAVSYKTVLRGVILYILVAYYFNNERILHRFIEIFLVVSFIIVLLTRLGVAGAAFSILSSNLSNEEQVFTRTERMGESLYVVRETFLNMDVNYYAAGLVVAMIVAVYYFLFGQANYLRIFICSLLIILGVISLLATGSRSGLIQMVLSLLTLFLFIRLDRKRKGRIFLIGIFVLVVLISSLFIVQIVSPFELMKTRMGMLVQGFESFTSIGAIRDNSTLRFFLAGEAIERLGGRWLFGTGGIRLFSLLYGTGNHSDIINWLTTYGIATFIPLVGIISNLVLALLEVRKVCSKQKVIDYQVIGLLSMQISLLVALIIRMISDPVGLILYLIIGVGSAVTAVSRKRIQLIST